MCIKPLKHKKFNKNSKSMVNFKLDINSSYSHKSNNSDHML